MFLTVLKEQSFGSDHFLVLFSMKSIKKKKKKKCFKRSLAFLSACDRAAGMGRRGLVPRPPARGQVLIKSSLTACFPFVQGGLGLGF